ncbi:hypothetical protein OH77DRAFT_1572606 [Trametes cingulata]|nr:hypothetical protein OH77DRAFT_1572606 [Trametes cingulata]
MADAMFEERNILLMDGVGVGKTIEATGMIALYEWLREYRNERGKFPQRFADTNSKRAKEDLPHNIHLIIAPPPLVEQWVTEIKKFLRCRSVAVIPYNGTCTVANREKLWAVINSTPKESPILLVAPFSAVKSDLTSNYYIPSKIAITYNEPRPRLQSPIAKINLFSADRQYAIIAIDEAHNARRAGPAYMACCELVKRAFFAIGMTATPIITSPNDLMLICRMLRIPGFTNPKMDEHHRAYLREKNKESRQREEQRHMTRRIVKGKKPEYEETPTLLTLFDWLDYSRKLLEKSVIRRTATSLDYEGKPIINLHPYVTVPVLVKLNEEETAVQQEFLIRLKDEKVNNKDFHSFYLGSRMALVHCRLPELPGYTFPDDQDSTKYSDFPSTKLDWLVKLAKYYENGVCKQPPVITKAGVEEPEYDPEWVRVPDAPKDKIIVFLAFPHGNWIVKKALDEAELAYLELNSKFSPQRRVEILKEFQWNPDVQLLLISNIGMTGLNLAFANILIGVDNLWSAQDTEQLIGRIWRHPQKKTVIYHPLIADKTSDAYIVLMSDDKAIMQMKLANIPIELKRIFELEDNGVGSSSEDSPPPEPKPKAKAKPRARGKAAAKPRKGKAAEVIDVDAEDDEGATAQAGPSRPKRAPKAKAAASSTKGKKKDTGPGNDDDIDKTGDEMSANKGRSAKKSPRQKRQPDSAAMGTSSTGAGPSGQRRDSSRPASSTQPPPGEDNTEPLSPEQQLLVQQLQEEKGRQKRFQAHLDEQRRQLQEQANALAERSRQQELQLQEQARRLEEQRRQQEREEEQRRQQEREEEQRHQQEREEEQRRQQEREEEQRRQQEREEEQRRQQALEEEERRKQLLEEEARRKQELEEEQRRKRALEEQADLEQRRLLEEREKDRRTPGPHPDNFAPPQPDHGQRSPSPGLGDPMDVEKEQEGNDPTGKGKDKSKRPASPSLSLPLSSPKSNRGEDSSDHEPDSGKRAKRASKKRKTASASSAKSTSHPPDRPVEDQASALGIGSQHRHEDLSNLPRGGRGRGSARGRGRVGGQGSEQDVGNATAGPSETPRRGGGRGARGNAPKPKPQPKRK